MSRKQWVVCFVLVAVTVLVGNAVMAGNGTGNENGNGLAKCKNKKADLGFTPGVHPWPCADGSEWPVALTGPFPMIGPTNEKIRSFDGTVLDAWLYRPQLPEGVKAPTVLWSSPYFGQTDAAGNDPAQNDNSIVKEVVPVNLLVGSGYAVAKLSSRGTGNSGGCFSWGAQEQGPDQAAAIQWLADQTWSNRRVGMMGLSAHSETALRAIVENPIALKTIVVGGLMTDWYTWLGTPQGAAKAVPGAPVFSGFMVAEAAPPFSASPQDLVTGYPPNLSHRYCEDQANFLTNANGAIVSSDRNASFWESRQHVNRFPAATSSVFLAPGFYDHGHAFQDDVVWNALDVAPKRMMIGDWGHVFPNFGGRPDWDATHLEWFDFWLKGLGSPPGVGTVEYQDDTKAWHTSSAWPPIDATEETLFLAGGGMETRPTDAAPTAFIAGPGMDFNPVTDLTKACYTSASIAEQVLVAGNPNVFLQVESNLRGGLITVDLFDSPAGTGCPQADSTRIAFGAADLRFHGGNFEGRDFPVGSPTGVRVDLHNLAQAIDEGRRLVLVIQGPSPISKECVSRNGLTPVTSPNGGCGRDNAGQPYFPLIKIHASGDRLSSQIVLPLVHGSLGGGPPPDGIPARPFAP